MTENADLSRASFKLFISFEPTTSNDATSTREGDADRRMTLPVLSARNESKKKPERFQREREKERESRIRLCRSGGNGGR